MELTVEQALREGIEAHKAGKVQDADRYYTAILKAQPKHPDANHNMGVLAVGVGKVQEALPFFKTAVEANPKVVQFWLSYIDALIKSDRITDAKAVFDQAKSNGAEGEAFDKLEKSLAGLGKGVEAKAVSRQLQEPPAAKLETLINLYNQKRHRELQTQASQLLKEFPNSINLYNIIGGANKSLGNFGEAIEAYKKAITLKPDFAEAYYNMGNALKEQGKLEEAIQAYTKTISINSNYAEAYLNLGNAFREQGKLEKAIESYTKAISINPNYAEAYTNMGNAFKEQGKLEEAIQAYNKAISRKPDYAEAYTNMGNALKEQGKLEETIQAYKKALSINPDYGSAKHMLSALTGDTVKTAPREYVEDLFDRYAEKFEASLVGDLEYRMPREITNILIKSNQKASLGKVLDLGCGSGLLGEEMRGHCSQLEGIDLSRKMLEFAKQKNVYDRLIHSDLVEYLNSSPLGFDYFIAADVFIYIGDLTEIFRLIKSRNKQPGHLVFSTEHTELDGYHLLETGRYSHSKSYIESLSKKFDYKEIHFSTANLRRHEDRFIIGGLYILKFTN